MALHRGPYGDVHMTSFGEVVRLSSGRNFTEWEMGGSGWKWMEVGGSGWELVGARFSTTHLYKFDSKWMINLINIVFLKPDKT